MKITNEVLLEKINNVHEEVHGVNKRLDKLNGQVALNTEHRIKQTTTNKVIWLLSSTFGLAIFGMFIKFI
ncbi:MAG: hypothetical protein VW262_05965 [Flavobacteriaceae bacterium]